MSDEGGIQMETLLIVLCIVAVFAAALIYAAKSGTRRVELLREFAAARGWTFSADDTEALAAKVDALSPGFAFRVSNVMRVETGPRSVRLFSYQYHHRERPRSEYWGVACLVESNALRGVGEVVEVVDRTALDTLLAGDQVAAGDADFSRQFIVISKDAAAAKLVLTPALQATLLRHRAAPLYNPVSVRVGPAGALVLNRAIDPDPERWVDLVELCRKVEADLR